MLAEDLISPFDVPSFRRSAMDGYAIKQKDLNYNSVFKVEGEIKAGEHKEFVYKKNICISVATGAMIPSQFDTVIKIEDTDSFHTQQGIFVKVLKKEKKGANIAEKGEDFKKGEKILKKGILIDSAVLALITYCGKREVAVYKSPDVSIIATGNEVKSPGEDIMEGQIYDCNSYFLYGLCLKYGGIPRMLGIAKDNVKSIVRYIKKELDRHIVLISGEVSEGKYDMVIDALKQFNAKIIFWKVAVKPGKPLLFALVEDRLVFGLPGYPVSSYIAFENFVRPAILKMQGKKCFERFKVAGVMRIDIENNSDRDEYVRVIVKTENEGNIILPYCKQKSGVFTSIVYTNGILYLKKDSRIRKGDKTVVDIYR